MNSSRGTRHVRSELITWYWRIRNALTSRYDHDHHYYMEANISKVMALIMDGSRPCFSDISISD